MGALYDMAWYVVLSGIVPGQKQGNGSRHKKQAHATNDIIHTRHTQLGWSVERLPREHTVVDHLLVRAPAVEGKFP